MEVVASMFCFELLWVFLCLVFLKQRVHWYSGYDTCLQNTIRGGTLGVHLFRANTRIDITGGSRGAWYLTIWHTTSYHILLVTVLFF